jgi:hypothetical protein
MSLVCPYCRTEIEPDSGNRIYCCACGTPHHKDCYAENGGCTVFGCSQAPPEEPKIQVSAGDLANSPAVPWAYAPPVYGAAAPGMAGAAPPPMPTAEPLIPPPPAPAVPLDDARVDELTRTYSTMPAEQLVGIAQDRNSTTPEAREALRMVMTARNVGEPSTPSGVPPATLQYAAPVGANSVYLSTPPPPAGFITGAYAPPVAQHSVFSPPRSRTTFVLLGFFLGAFGAHNFYAGYTGKAIAQLLITLFTFGLAGVVSWIWAVVEICVVSTDSRNVPFV